MPNDPNVLTWDDETRRAFSSQGITATIRKGIVSGRWVVELTYPRRLAGSGGSVKMAFASTSHEGGKREAEIEVRNAIARGHA